MIQRYWRFLLAALIVLALVLGFWLWNRPEPEASLEHLTLENGAALTRVLPGTSANAYVALAVLSDEGLTDKQLLALSQDADAEIVQVTLPKDNCALQQQTLDAGIEKLNAAPTLVAGIGPGATLAWRWLADRKSVV